MPSWAAWYNTGLLIKLTPKGVVFSFLCSLLPLPGVHCNKQKLCNFVVRLLKKGIFHRNVFAFVRLLLRHLFCWVFHLSISA